jgi:hypothetical protein
VSGPYNGTAGNYRFDMVTFSGSVVPEPSSVIVAGLALVGLVVAERAKRRNQR